MSLYCQISKAGITYELRCDGIEHTFTRLPTQAGLPSLEGSQEDVITIDLGICIEQIILTGVVNTTSAGGNDPSKVDLETVIGTWWAYGDTVTSLPTLQIPSGSYKVHLKVATFRMEGAIEDRWIFSLTWLVREKV